MITAEVLRERDEIERTPYVYCSRDMVMLLEWRVPGGYIRHDNMLFMLATRRQRQPEMRQPDTETRPPLTEALTYRDTDEGCETSLSIVCISEMRLSLPRQHHAICLNIYHR